MIVLKALRTANQDRVTANSHPRLIRAYVLESKYSGVSRSTVIYSTIILRVTSQTSYSPEYITPTHTHKSYHRIH